MKNFPDILVNAIPAFILLMAVEIFYAYQTRKELFETKDTATSISLGLGNLVMAVITKSLLLLVYVWIYQYRFFTLSVSVWWTWALCFLADDFSYYWFHRISHEVRFFWASHAVHHSSEKYNLAAALRQNWTGNITGTFLFWAWMPLVGFQPGMVLLMQSISLLYQYWIHTEAIHRLPRWFEYIFNTPSHHRVHHGSDLLYLDKNHAGTLIIWDRIFGTYQEEIFRPTYGLTKNVQTFNPVKVAFHEWIRMANDIKRSPKHTWQYLTKAPGWSHDGTTQTTKKMQKKGLQ